MRVIIEALGINKPYGGRTAILNTIKGLPIVAPDVQFIVYLSSFEPDLANFPHLQQRIIRTSNRFLLILHAVKMWTSFTLPRISQQVLSLVRI
jgi:hypothetical protein